ncbi:MAG TPA: amidohydrolase family protein [Candidatus Acidoferrales bacterium]|nr:amidohydrolase family protein [Candidatus Acidoferrales bacterium]
MRFSVFTLLALLALLATTVPAPAQDACSWSRDLRLVNGKIHTLDAQDRVVNEVTIQAGRFAYVGPLGNRKLNPCTKVINLHGRVVVPGLIDDHNHFVLFSQRPGYDVMVETATSIPQAMALLKDRARTVPAGSWVTAIGDWTPRLFAENRLPTLPELDQAVPDHPVFFATFGPAVTNSLGKKFFESKGITVGSTGALQGPAANAALAELRKMQTLDDKIRSAEYAQSYVLRYGLTTSVDMGVFADPESPDLQDSFTFPGIASANPWTVYDQILALDHQHKLDERVRLFMISMDKTMALPILTERLLNVFPDFGDGMLRISGIGEFASPWFANFAGGQHPENYEAALRLVAKHGWTYQQHTLSLPEVQFTAQTYEKVNAVTPIADLHWSIAHVPAIDPQTLQSMKAIGVGMALHGWKYLQGGHGTPAGQPAGPPYRTILESGIHAGAGSDAGDIAVLDPWFEIYYMVTGKDCTGALINSGEQVTRQQALRMYTADNGWFFHEDNELGSIETGKLGDLVVLSDDYFDPKRVSDEGIKQLKSVLTVVGGRIVYNDIH